MTPLLFAARDGSLEAARVLVEAGAKLNAEDTERWSVSSTSGGGAAASAGGRRHPIRGS